MSATPAERLTVPELARMMRDAIRNRDYQSDTRLGSAVRDYLAWKRLSASARTLVIYEGYLARLCLFLAETNPAVEDVSSEMLLDSLLGYETPSLRTVRAAYGDFFKWACRWGHTERNPVDLLPRIPKPPMKVYEVFTAAEQAQLLKATDRMPLPWVHRLRVLTLLDLGTRKDEARKLTPSKFDMVARAAIVHGKGDKERIVPVGDDLWRALVTFQNRPLPATRQRDERGPFLEDRRPGDDSFIFFPYGVTQSGTVRWTDPSKQFSDRGMHAWWDRLIEEAGIRYRSMHMCRHTVGTDLASAEADSFTIRDWLGHADVSTTQVYVHNSRGRLQRGRGKLDDYRRAQEG